MPNPNKPSKGGNTRIAIPKSVFETGRKKYKEGGDDLNLEPGNYFCVLKSGKVLNTNNGPKVLLEGKPVGDDVGQNPGTAKMWYGLGEDQIHFLFRDLAKLGYDVDALDQDMLEEIFADIAQNAPVVKIKVVERNGYTNVNILALADDYSAEDFSDGDTASQEEETEEEETEEEETEEEETEEEETEEEDVLAALDRDQLKSLIKRQGLGVKVLKSMDDDALRVAIRADKKYNPNNVPTF